MLQNFGTLGRDNKPSPAIGSKKGKREGWGEREKRRRGKKRDNDRVRDLHVT